VGAIELCLTRRTAVAAETALAGAGEGVDDPVGRHDAHDVVEGVGDIERAVRRDGDVTRRVELRVLRRPAVAAVPLNTRPDYRRAGVELVDQAKLVVAGIRHVDAVARIDRDAAGGRRRLALRPVELGERGGTAVAQIARYAGAGKRVNDAVGLEQTQAIV